MAKKHSNPHRKDICLNSAAYTETEAILFTLSKHIYTCFRHLHNWIRLSGKFTDFRQRFALFRVIYQSICASIICLCIIQLNTMHTYSAEANGLSLDIRVETDNSTPLMPRANVPYKLYVDNMGNEAWIRIYLETYSENINRTFGNEYINNADGWIRHGNYLYLTRKAAAGETLLAIDGFRIPDVANSSNATVKISVHAEGIDVRALTPDFTRRDPWMGHTPDTVADLDDTSGTDLVDNSSDNSKTGGSQSSGGSADGSSGNQSSGSSSSRSSGGSSNSSSSHSSGGSSQSSSSALTGYKAPTANAVTSSGTWKLIDADNNIWQYADAGGRLAKDGWYYIYNSTAREGGSTQWFYFNNSGYMQTGWAAMNTTDWYHLHETSDGSLGALTTGWYTDTQDNKRYYLDNVTGLMQSGWKTIGDKSYYFTNLSEIPGPGWVYTLISGTSFGRWLYNSLNARSYGSMYINETTPDGSRVDSSGAKI